jgi:tRNA-modifying protein YgfZ
MGTERGTDTMPTTPTAATGEGANPAGYRSPLLDLPGAVPADAPDTGVAAHYGDPLREQRVAGAGAAVVDRSHRGVIRIDGPDRLSWLHSITSQHLTGLRPMRGSEALVLSPHGHVEHHLVIADDGTTTWLDVEPGTAPALLGYLESMRFLLRVSPADATDAVAVLSVLGPGAVPVVLTALPAILPPGEPQRDAVAQLAEVGDVHDDRQLTAGPYPVVRLSAEPAGWTAAEPVGAAAKPAPGGPTVGVVLARRLPYGVDLLVPRAALAATARRLAEAGAPVAGMSAFEALRIAARRPRLGRETDHRTIPHEVGWLLHAVHLDKGCYRGQETVARVHNLGRPPRRMALLHLDGAVAAAGTPVTASGRPVGFVGSSGIHAELGPIALAVVKRSVPDDAALVVTDPDGHEVAAAMDPDPGPLAPAPTIRAGAVRPDRRRH